MKLQKFKNFSELIPVPNPYPDLQLGTAHGSRQRPRKNCYEGWSSQRIELVLKWHGGLWMRCVFNRFLLVIIVVPASLLDCCFVPCCPFFASASAFAFGFGFGIHFRSQHPAIHAIDFVASMASVLVPAFSYLWMSSVSLHCFPSRLTCFVVNFHMMPSWFRAMREKRQNI